MYFNKLIIFRLSFTPFAIDIDVTFVMEYAHSVWSPHKQYLIEKIEKVQKRATKLVSASINLSYKQGLICLKLPTL